MSAGGVRWVRGGRSAWWRAAGLGASPPTASSRRSQSDTLRSHEHGSARAGVAPASRRRGGVATGGSDGRLDPGESRARLGPR